MNSPSHTRLGALVGIEGNRLLEGGAVRMAAEADSTVLDKVQSATTRGSYDDTDWAGGANALVSDVAQTLNPITRPISQSLDRTAGAIDKAVKSNSMVAESGRVLSNSLAAASGAVEATTRKASIIIQKNFRGQQARNEVKREFHMSNVVMQARACSKATSNFKKLTKPRRPPFPGTATPPGYVIHLHRPPHDRDRGERFRDWLLWLGTHRWVAALQLIWILALVTVFVIFVCCLMYWFSWGEQTDYEWGCTRNSTCCTCVLHMRGDEYVGALTYKLEDLWQERMTQGLSALFTYSVLLATPWRVSVLVQLFHRRMPLCSSAPLRLSDRRAALSPAQLLTRSPRAGTGTHDKAGVDFYGRKNEMPFFHIPWRARLGMPQTSPRIPCPADGPDRHSCVRAAWRSSHRHLPQSQHDHAAHPSGSPLCVARRHVQTTRPIRGTGRPCSQATDRQRARAWGCPGLRLSRRRRPA